MVIPWAGYSLSELIKWAEPLPKAKYVQFLSLEDRAIMPGISEINLNWPYSEGLRMDEAMHPLTLLTFGLYGEVLPNQDGAPVRTRLAGALISVLALALTATACGGGGSTSASTDTRAAPAAERPRRWTTSTSGVKRMRRPRARMAAQKSTSSVYMK